MRPRFISEIWHVRVGLADVRIGNPRCNVVLPAGSEYPATADYVAIDRQHGQERGSLHQLWIALTSETVLKLAGVTPDPTLDVTWAVLTAYKEGMIERRA